MTEKKNDAQKSREERDKALLEANPTYQTGQVDTTGHTVHVNDVATHDIEEIPEDAVLVSSTEPVVVAVQEGTTGEVTSVEEAREKDEEAKAAAKKAEEDEAKAADKAAADKKTSGSTSSTSASAKK